MQAAIRTACRLPSQISKLTFSTNLISVVRFESPLSFFYAL